MITKIKQTLENALKVLSDNKDAIEKDGYHALAADMANSMREITDVLTTNVLDDDPRKEMDRPFIGRGLDDRLYLAFKGNWDVERFLNGLGIKGYGIHAQHFGGYENALLIAEDEGSYGFGHPIKHKIHGGPVKEAELWLRAISTWLLTTDNDMKLPDGILDTDPLDLADRLGKLDK